MNTNNPIILLCCVNTKLRDQYKSLDDLCDDLNVCKEDIIEKLSGINYYYDEKTNQFK